MNRLQPVSVAVETVTDEVMDEVWRLVRTSESKDGAGLAANQIGIQRRMFVTKIGQGIYRVCFNPAATVDDLTPVCTSVEGCLSVPGLTVPVSRPARIVGSWFDGTKTDTETMEGMPARVFLHELDHLDGRSILDHANRQTRRAMLHALSRR